MRCRSGTHGIRVGPCWTPIGATGQSTPSGQDDVSPDPQPLEHRRASPIGGAGARVDVVARHDRLVWRTLLVSGLTLASRVIGFARESMAAAIFGDVSAINDAFVTAWRVPNLFRSLLGEGAM